MTFDRIIGIVGLLISITGLVYSANSWVGYVVFGAGAALLLYALWLHFFCPPYKDLYVGFRFDFTDPTAKCVPVVRKTTFKVCGRNVTSISPKFITATGRLENFRCSFGRFASADAAGGGVNLRIDFADALSPGSTHSLAVAYDAVDCFTNKAESVSFQGIKHLAVGELEVNFHPERVPTKVAKVFYRKGKRKVIQVCEVSPDFPSVYWQFTAAAGRDFVMEWSWPDA